MNYDAFRQKYNIALNPQQERAVRKVNGPALLLAVPGSGKTTVIVARVGYMMFCAGIRPENILTLTFSRAAASEMKQRFFAVFGADVAEQPRFGTIHSFCLSVIRKCEAAYGLHVPQLVTDTGSLIRKVFIGEFYEVPTETTVNELSRNISYCKNMMIDGIRLEGIDMGELDFRRFYEEYEEYKHKNDLMDFDDQLLYAYRLLEEYPEMLDAIQDRYRYINIDEAQDTSLLQHNIIKKLSSKYENLFMVGDEDQSIYRFRAAYPEALLRFRNDHPEADIMLLETNYRCAENIVKAADRIIRTNKNRYEKNMKAERRNGVIYETRLRDAGDQYTYLVRVLGEAAAQGREVAVLYRNNESAVPLIDLLEKEGIPFNTDTVMLFYDHDIVKDMICTLRLIINRRDLEAYKAVYYKLGLYTTRRQYLMVKERIERNAPGTVFEILAEAEERNDKRRQIREFGRELARLENLRPFDALREAGGLFYRKWMEQKAAEGTETMRSLEHKLDTLLALSSEYGTIGEFISRVWQLARGNANIPKRSGRDGTEENRGEISGATRGIVTLSTIHSSKGMEFDKVVLIDMYQGILPSGRVSGAEFAADDGYEEEVRLFYVALTRARDEIEVVTAPKLFGKHLERSPFVDMLFENKRRIVYKKQKAAKQTVPDDGPGELYVAGTKLKHKYFGEGIIINRTGDIIRVRFEEGDKNMLLSAALKWGYIEPSD